MDDLPPLPEFLYHGTAYPYFPHILEHGIKPGQRDNWKHTVTSDKQTVYLTNCYGLYFAQCAMDQVGADKCVVLEIDMKRVPEILKTTRFVCDEDALEQICRYTKEEVNGYDHNWPMKRRTIWWRSRAHQYRAELSLKHLGTCGYRGIIQPGWISRAAIVTHSKTYDLVWAGHDPIVGVREHMIVGGKYKQFTPWLFGDADDWLWHPEEVRAAMGVDHERLTRDGIEVVEFHKQKEIA